MSEKLSSLKNNFFAHMHKFRWGNIVLWNKSNIVVILLKKIKKIKR
jgi:hypothetical protein